MIYMYLGSRRFSSEGICSQRLINQILAELRQQSILVSRCKDLTRDFPMCVLDLISCSSRFRKSRKGMTNKYSEHKYRIST